jgi:hypothetical protein
MQSGLPQPQRSAAEEGYRVRAPNRPEKSQHYNNRDSNARMKQVEQEIFPVDVVDIAVVSVGPIRGPYVNNGERVAPVLETRLALSRSRAVQFKRVLAAELGAELVVGNAAPTMVGRALRVLG